MDLKSNLSGLLENFKDLEAKARELPNQNFADIVKSTSGKVSQLLDHPDLELVNEKMNGLEQSPPPFDPKGPPQS